MKVKLLIDFGQSLAEEANCKINFASSGKKLDKEELQIFVGSFEKRFKELNK